uniref:Uncharacterized protein n=1 Tax=Chrysotila carterae TaxID=13221 RepID=A0A7S4FAE7_CHRCT
MTDILEGLRDALLHLPFEVLLFGSGVGSLKQYSRSHSLRPSMTAGHVVLCCEGQLHEPKMQLLVQLREGFKLNGPVPVEGAWAWAADEVLAFDRDSLITWEEIGTLSPDTPVLLRPVDPSSQGIMEQDCHVYILLRFDLTKSTLNFTGWPSNPLNCLEEHVKKLAATSGQQLLNLLCMPPDVEWSNNMEFLCRLAARRCDAIECVIDEQRFNKEELQGARDWIMSTLIDRIWLPSYAERRKESADRLKGLVANSPAMKKTRQVRPQDAPVTPGQERDSSTPVEAQPVNGTEWKPQVGVDALYKDGTEGKERIVRVTAYNDGTELYQIEWYRHTTAELLLHEFSSRKCTPPLAHGTKFIFAKTNELVKVSKCYEDGAGGYGVEIQVERHTPAERLRCPEKMC